MTLQFFIITCVLILQGNSVGIPFHESRKLVPSCRMCKAWHTLEIATTANQLLDLTSNIAQDVSSQCQDYHQSHVQQLYISIIGQQHVNITQIQLVQLLHTITEQNKQLGINLTVPVWHSFFSEYYKLPNQHKETYCIKLLSAMGTSGSNVQPDLRIFNIILFGITRQSNAFARADSIADYLIDIMINPAVHHIPGFVVPIPPDETTFQLLFRIFVQKGNIHRTTQLLLNHPSIRFADADMVVYNKVLWNLPRFAGGYYALSTLLRVFLDQIIGRGLSFDDETYSILFDLYGISRQCPAIKDVLENTRVPPNDDNVWGIVLRQQGNLHRTTQLLLDSMIVGADIAIYNRVLRNLPSFVDEASGTSFAQVLRVLLDQIIDGGLYFDEETYYILTDLYYQCDIKDVLENIRQPNAQHDKVWRIVCRERQLQLGKSTVGYQNFRRVVPHHLHVHGTLERPSTPKAHRLNSKRAWDVLIRRWRRALHEFDDIVDRNQTESDS
eukprot:158342_1